MTVDPRFLAPLSRLRAHPIGAPIRLLTSDHLWIWVGNVNGFCALATDDAHQNLVLSDLPDMRLDLSEPDPSKPHIDGLTVGLAEFGWSPGENASFSLSGLFIGMGWWVPRLKDGIEGQSIHVPELGTASPHAKDALRLAVTILLNQQPEHPFP